MEEGGDHVINIDEETHQDVIPIYIQLPTSKVDGGAAQTFQQAVE